FSIECRYGAEGQDVDGEECRMGTLPEVGTDSARVADAARTVVREHDPRRVPVTELLGACYDAGLSWVHFPEGQGGLGVSRGLQAVADGILQEAGAPAPFSLNPIGYGMAAPTLHEHAGTDELK